MPDTQYFPHWFAVLSLMSPLNKKGNKQMSLFHFSAPGYYRIEVKGHIPPDWSNRLGAMQLFYPSPKSNNEVTLLQGMVSDQAELAGILNSLYELHLSLLSVQCLGDQPPAEDGADK
jgi:hypothetical protein